MPRKIMVAGNWKMNNTVEQAGQLVADIEEGSKDIHKVDVVVAPPFTALHTVYNALAKSSVQVAAQDIYWEDSGAFTGQVSPIMVKEAGAKWVIIGHSERRQFFAETDETVNRKVKAALGKAKLKTIVCVGESLQEREEGRTFDILDWQVAGGLSGLTKKMMQSMVIAYEPVWAIGTGKSASPEQAQETHERIRAKIADLFDAETARKTRILYGGSVKPGNAEELFRLPDIDGGLIGGASLKATDFLGIIRAGVAAS